ncbi:hypothetical protein [Nitrosomonas marina]|uniref:N-acetyltransferase domain-containing protein n=1 Tax=Nitrosomonas marina TaxID=917 RepID=A0A1H8FJB3_9PROT|nr:hypothetical protein [Nitrosomonas marina]SEN31715.1 hypothetical protein SAMN05216325_11364 [Nitrosomonas marina]
MSNNPKKHSAVDVTNLTPILEGDLDDVALFLHHHMNNRFTQSEWKQGISQSWMPKVPNYGFMLKNDAQIVGVLCAIYSEQSIAGELKRFCNPHSWCVLAEFRKRSIELVLALIQQKVYTFTMFSPNKDGLEIFRYLKFKPLDNHVLILLNWPSAFGAGQILEFRNNQQLLQHLPEPVAKHYQDHAHFSWLNYMFFKEGNRYGFLIYKRRLYKRLGSAWIMHVSDAALFRQCWPAIRAHLLLKHGLFTSKIEARLLDQPIKSWFKPEQGAQKFYLSDEISADNIQNLYSELVALDL